METGEPVGSKVAVQVAYGLADWFESMVHLREKDLLVSSQVSKAAEEAQLLRKSLIISDAQGGVLL